MYKCIISLPHYRPRRKVMFFRSVCHSVHRGICLLGKGGLSTRWSAYQGVLPHGNPRQWHPVAAAAAVGIYPTGMHSCFKCFRYLSAFPSYHILRLLSKPDEHKHYIMDKNGGCVTRIHSKTYKLVWWPWCDTICVRRSLMALSLAILTQMRRLMKCW